jgi:hypothetical protein
MILAAAVTTPHHRLSRNVSYPTVLLHRGSVAWQAHVCLAAWFGWHTTHTHTVQRFLWCQAGNCFGVVARHDGVCWEWSRKLGVQPTPSCSSVVVAHQRMTTWVGKACRQWCACKDAAGCHWCCLNTHRHVQVCQLWVWRPGVGVGCGCGSCCGRGGASQSHLAVVDNEWTPFAMRRAWWCTGAVSAAPLVTRCRCLEDPRVVQHRPATTTPVSVVLLYSAASFPVRSATIPRYHSRLHDH